MGSEMCIRDRYMRKPAEHAPLSKELIHSIQDDGSVKLSKSMRELQRRWRNTVRIEEQLYAPDELLDRAVLDDDGLELGVVIGLVKVKRTYRGITVKLRSPVRRRYALGETIDIPVTSLARTRARLDEIVLSRTYEKLRSLPSYIQINEGVLED